jgi:hypothetical protein
MTYPWYTDVPAGASLEQGDIIEKCNILLPDEKHYQAINSDVENETPMNIIEIDGIIMSQSCDIENGKINSLILCPLRPLSKLMQENSYFKASDARENLRQGKLPSYHLLEKLSTNFLLEDYYIVDFHHIHSVPKKFIENIISNKNRIRLLPPYREHLSQSFARYFMRVGLPSDISREEIKNYTTKL